MVSLSDTTLYFCDRRHSVFHTQRYFHRLHHSVESHWRLQPSRRQNRSRAAQRLISADIPQTPRGAREGARLLCATTLLPWRSGSGNFQEFPWHCHSNLDDLVKPTRHLDVFFPFSKNLSAPLLLFWPPWRPPPPWPPSFIQACPQFSSFVRRFSPSSLI